MEEELMSQRDAAISLTKVLQRDVTEQLERLEERAEAAERGRVRAEVALCQLTDAHEHHANADESQLSVIYRSWVCGLIGGWLGGAIVASMLSPALGFLLVVPCTSLCLLGGVVLAAVGRRAAAARRRVASYGHKEEYIALLGGAASQEEGGTGCGPPPPSRRQNPPGRRLRSGGSADGGDGGCGGDGGDGGWGRLTGVVAGAAGAAASVAGGIWEASQLAFGVLRLRGRLKRD